MSISFRLSILFFNVPELVALAVSNPGLVAIMRGISLHSSRWMWMVKLGSLKGHMLGVMYSMKGYGCLMERNVVCSNQAHIVLWDLKLNELEKETYGGGMCRVEHM